MGTGASGSDDISGLTARIRRNGRSPAVLMATFLLGTLTAALFIPSHRTSGVNAGGGSVYGLGSTAGGASGGALGVGAAGESGTGLGPSATGPGPGTGAAAGGVGGSDGDAVGPGSTIGASGGAVGPGAAGVGGGVGASGSTTATPPGGNGGATAVGVTATSITVGILGGNSQAIGPVCPRCAGIDSATDQATVSGMIAAWHKEGKLPIYGRDLKPFFQSANDLDTTGASEQEACENLETDKPFVVLTGAGTDDSWECLTQTYHTLAVDAAGGQAAEGAAGNQPVGLYSEAPYLWELGPSMETVLTGWASWANQMGLLKGQVLGLYEEDDADDNGLQEILNATFVAQLKKLGYQLKVDYAYSGEGESDDAVAVAKMKAAGVTVVFVSPTLTEPAGFQSQATQVGYHPKYPVADQGSYAFTDAEADISYNADAENGNSGLGYRWWNWSARDPATPADNQAAAQCVSAYEAETGTTLDVYKDDAQLRYILDECSDLDVILAAMTDAGPHLTQTTFIQAIEKIQDMQTPEYESVSFGPGQYFGDNVWQSESFNDARWQPSNDYWKPVGAYTPWSVWPQDQSTVAAAIQKGQ